MRFEMGQRFVSKSDPSLTAGVVQLLDEGREAEFALRKDGELLEYQRANYAQFIAHWVPI